MIEYILVPLAFIGLFAPVFVLGLAMASKK